MFTHIIQLRAGKTKRGKFSAFNNLYLHPCNSYLNMLVYPLNTTPTKEYKHLLFHRIGNELFTHRVSFPLLWLLLLAVKAVQQLLDYIILCKNKPLL